MKTFFAIAIIALLLEAHGNCQDKCDSIRFWTKSDEFVEFDTTGRHIQMTLFLSDEEFVFEQFDHWNDRIIFGKYDIDSLGTMNMRYELEKTIEFQKANRDTDCEIRFGANRRCYRFTNWKLSGNYITVDYTLRDGQPDIKKYRFKKK
jgi:hypothetical protein